MAAASLHVHELPDGPLDFVGDVHGEARALERLLGHLGYGADGTHPEGRRLVFLGDLVDRGPDSLAVLRRVRDLIDAGTAQCVVGNHELNLVLGKERSGNEWFWGREQRLRGGELPIPQQLAGDREREEVLLFIQSLPLALERDGLRAVHACWHGELIDGLRGERRGLAELFYASETGITAAALAAGHAGDSLHADLERQNRNPVTALTSGIERPAAEEFRAGGRLRRVERVAWWDDYHDDEEVFFGHYWRALDHEHRPVKRGPYLFDGKPWHEPLGPRGNAWCLDYSAGARNVERVLGSDHAPTALMALRHPERILIDDRGGVHRRGD